VDKNTSFYQKTSISANGNFIDLSKPKVMGILNCTPDSFFEGSRIANAEIALKKAAEMVAQGADIIDIGGYSTRPGASDISETEEINRTLAVAKSIKKEFPNIPISIDTFRSQVALAHLDQGVEIINDISAGQLDANMFQVIQQYKPVYIMMHLRGTPQNMMEHCQYEDIVNDLTAYFNEKITAIGIDQIIIDPGFGFAKTISQNFELLHRLTELKSLGQPILAGLSRKSMIYKSLNITADEALNGTTALQMTALHAGAQILRVHDVLAAKQCVTLFNLLNKN
jgi:dihydropteroate synthase